MQLEPGMRVRCVDAGSFAGRQLNNGVEYEVAAFEQTNNGPRLNRVWLKGENRARWFNVYRFKPVVRVKARTMRVEADGCCHRTVMSCCKGCPYA